MISSSNKFRFINSVESLDQKNAWENVKKVRNDFIKSYNGSSCKYLVPSKDIKKNIQLFKNLVNSSSSNLQKNLTKDVINRGAKLFLYLNTCPKTSNKKEISKFFDQVFKKYLFEPTNSGIILYTLNAMKLFSNDGRIIATKLLEKISTLFKLSFIPSQKGNFLKEAAKGLLRYITYISLNWK